MGDGGPVQTSIVYVGCNRLSGSEWDPASNPSSANTAQLKRTFSDVAALGDTPSFFFFTGDLVLGLDADTAVLGSELSAWAGLHEGDPSGIAAKVPLVPLVGNHEMLVKKKGDETSNPGAGDVWKSFIAAHGYDAHAGNGPTAAPPNADSLQGDESRLSYSFDSAGVHYVVLDTDSPTTLADPSIDSTHIGWIALHWLTADLAAAEARSDTNHILVFGHKPIVAPSGKTTSDEAIDPLLTSDLEALLDGTSKVRGYFCAHAHLWDSRRLPGKRGVPQIIAGNGGSEVESSWDKPVYGFTEVRIHQDGKVGVVSWQRPVPSPYDAMDAAPAKAEPEILISP